MNECILKREEFSILGGKLYCLVYCSIVSWLRVWFGFKILFVVYYVYNYRLNDLLYVIYFLKVFGI